jgi:hypothetical protein
MEEVSMKFNTLLIINAIVAFIFAIGALLAPTMMLTMYAMDLNPAAQLMVRYFGACLLGFGVLSWLSRSSTDATARRAIIMAFLVFDAAGVVVSVAGTIAGIMGPFGWSVVAILLLLGIGFAYQWFASTRSQAH